MKSIRNASLLTTCFSYSALALAGVPDAVRDTRSMSDPAFPESFDGVVTDFIFGSSLEPTNGAISCASATRLVYATTNVADTSSFPDWITALGPIPSPAPDAIYSFKPGPAVGGTIMPIAADFDFAMYVIPECSDSPVQPAPLAATSTIGDGIDLAEANLVMFQRYYLVVTAVPAAGPAATGRVRFTAPPTLAIDNGP